MENDQLNIFLYNWWRSIDRKIFIITILLLLIGCLISFAATPSIAIKYGLDPYYFAKKHLIFAPAAFFFIFFTSLFSRLGIKRFFLFIFLLSIFFIFYSFFIGIESKGSIRWVSFFGYSFQPSEFLKVSFIIICASIFSSKNYFPMINNQFFSFLLYLFVSSLILYQPDFSMFVIISFVYFGQLFISGLNKKWVAASLLFFSFVFSATYYFSNNVKLRIDNFLFSTGDNYQISKSLEAIKEGSLFGKGPGLGTVKENIPDAHTDFIFSVIAEEFGLLSCLLIIVFFIYLIFNICKKIKNEKHLFIILCVSGLVMQLGSQIFVNIGSTIGLIPTTGATLPFISYGGSSMISTALNIGVILALTRVSYKDSIMSDEKGF
ncbi:MAG: FtsW/RodA/SpoVE family cell cycle protein [Alphaproteobacteria bacterium]|nr:FtsW/RodA/SpoVE family cell cycle protein [Alphaproteobacteria bacterium]